MGIYCLESFKEHMEEVGTEHLISYIEGIMTHVLESGLPVEKEERVSGIECIYTINAGQGNTIKLVETAFSSSIEYKLLVNNIQVDWLIDQDFRKDFISKVIESYCFGLEFKDSRQTCFDVLLSWYTMV